MKQPGRKAAAEKARAARRVAQLRKEAEDRAEESLTKNEMLARLGSAFRLPEEDGQEEERTSAHEPPATTEPQPTRSTPKRRSKADGYNFSAEDISALRAKGLSWKQISVNLELGSPGAARTAYTALTGKPHNEAEGAVRRKASVVAQGRKLFIPVWDDESNQDEIIERLRGAQITIERSLKGITWSEELVVGRVTRLTWDGEDQKLCVHFTERENGAARSVLVSNIKEVL